MRARKPKDFIAESETWNNKKSKRIYLNNDLTRELTAELQDHFKSMMKIPRIMRGEKQEFETLINEEALLFAKYLRNERAEWIPRIVALFQNEPRCLLEDCFTRHIW